MSAGANIACSVCGARPFPELSLPAIVRECDDLMKVGDRWVCDEHRPKIRPPAPRAKPEGTRKIRDDVARILGRGIGLDIETKEALRAVIDRLDRLVEETTS